MKNKKLPPELQKFLKFKEKEAKLMNSAIEEVSQYTGETVVGLTLLGLDLKKELLEEKDIESLVEGIHEIISDLTGGARGAKLTTKK